MEVIEKQVFLRRDTKLPQELRIHGSAIDAGWLAQSDGANVLWISGYVMLTGISSG